MKIQQYKALELDTGATVEGYYYLENGYYMNEDVPDLSRPTERHYIVDYSGRHCDILETTLEPIATVNEDSLIKVSQDGMVFIQLGDGMVKVSGGFLEKEDLSAEGILCFGKNTEAVPVGETIFDTPDPECPAALDGRGFEFSIAFKNIESADVVIHQIEVMKCLMKQTD